MLGGGLFNGGWFSLSDTEAVPYTVLGSTMALLLEKKEELVAKEPLLACLADTQR